MRQRDSYRVPKRRRSTAWRAAGPGICAGWVLAGALAAEAQWTVSSRLESRGGSLSVWTGAVGDGADADGPGILGRVPLADRLDLAGGELRRIRKAREDSELEVGSLLARAMGVAADALAPGAGSGSTGALADEPAPPGLAIEVGAITLQPNLSGQWVTLQIRNLSAAALEVAGFNLSLQVADTGPASEGGRGTVNGPNIQSVDLGTGTLFKGNHGGTVSGGGSAQAGQWSIVTASGTVKLDAGALVDIARIQFDTLGFTEGGESWPLSLSLVFPDEGLVASTTLVSGMGDEWIVSSAGGTLTVVPEPESVAVVSCGLLALAAWGLRRRR